MNTTLSNTASHQAASPAYQAFRILHVGFVVAPILAGLDKFFHLLMLVVGVIEIVAGIGVAFKPRIFAYVGMAGSDHRKSAAHSWLLRCRAARLRSVPRRVGASSA